MNRSLVREAVDNIRRIVQEKGRYRRLATSEMVDVEAYLQQILLEVESVRDPWLNRFLKRTDKGA